MNILRILRIILVCALCSLATYFFIALTIDKWHISDWDDSVMVINLFLSAYIGFRLNTKLDESNS